MKVMRQLWGRTPLSSRDLCWIGWRILRETFFRACSPLSTRTHLKIAFACGRTRARIRRPRNSQRDEIQLVLAGKLEETSVESVVRRHEEFLNRTYLVKLLPRLLSPDDGRICSVEGVEHLEAALDRERGVILASAHLGYPRLIAPILRVQGRDVLRVVSGKSEDMKRRCRFGEWVSREGDLPRRVRRRIHEAVFCPYDIVASLDVRPILDGLSRNKVIMVAGDGTTASEFVEVPLLGRKYPFPCGFMKIAMLTGATVLPTFVIDGEKGFQIRMEIYPELDVDPNALVMNLEGFAKVVETQLRRAPHLWYRWKRLASCNPVESHSRGRKRSFA